MCSILKGNMDFIQLNAQNCGEVWINVNHVTHIGKRENEKDGCIVFMGWDHGDLRTIIVTDTMDQIGKKLGWVKHV